MQPEITNQRGEKEWLYIVNLVGEKIAIEAFKKLGNRKPYPLNIARILKIQLPTEEFLPSLDSEKENYKKAHKNNIEGLRKALKS